VASSVAPAEEWRRQLALHLFTPEQVAIRTVFTCAPGNLRSAKGFVDPEEAREKYEQVFLRDILERIERRGLGFDLTYAAVPVAYAPLEGRSGYDAGIAARLQKEIHEPFGARGWLNAFLLDSRGEILGWIGVGTRQPSPEALRDLGPQLTEIAREASRTLQATLDLAAGCGARVPRVAGATAARLTPREAEIARMVATGCSDLNIARSLEISENTVGSHLRRVYAKLGVHSRAEIAALVCGYGILDGREAV
jgi:DNA-binding CsgD family transcriptional regulator